MVRGASSWRRCAVFICALFVSSQPDSVQAQSAGNVAVVINDNSPESRRIGEHYARTRALPAANVFHIRVSPDEEVGRAAYSTAIEAPIAKAIRQADLQDQLLYIVLTKGVPLRVTGTTGLSGTLASVDSELTLLYRRMTGVAVAPDGKVDNPYYLGTRDLRDAVPFSHREHDIYLVTRIDAYTVDEALALIDRAQTPVQDGSIVLDQIDNDPTRPANRWMEQAAERLKAQGQGSRVAVDVTTKTATHAGPTLGFYAWGATDTAQRRRTTGLTFAPGAIAAHLASANARTFTAPPDAWVPSGSNQPATFFAGSSETLVGDLIREGVTGVAGQVGEPYVLGTVRPEILLPAYLAGFNLAEAFYLATPTLSWTNIVVGDPLCRPFAGRSVPLTDLETAIDPRTGLPRFFAQRRLARAATIVPELTEDALAATLRAENLIERGDTTTARTALEEAVKLAPKTSGLILTLAHLNETDGKIDEAIAGYRRVVELQPRNVVALNNLAFALAVHRKAPADALPLAERAAKLAPSNANVLDTLGWVEHLLGNHEAAARILTDASKLDPGSAETHLHLAVVAMALGQRTEAERALNEAVRLDPSLNERDESKALRERLKP